MISQIVKVCMEFPQSIPFFEFREKYKILKDFFALLVTQPIYPVKIELGCDSKNDNREDQYVSDQLIEYYYDIPSIVRKQKNVSGRNMIYRLNEYKNKLGIMLNNWFNKSDLLHLVLDLFFGTMYNDNLFTNNTFLNYMQAIETYHRTVYGGYDLCEDQHKERISIILNSINDGNIKRWLDGKLTFSNEINFRKRLNFLFNKYDYIICININKRNILIKKLVDTRNYFTHFSKNGNSRIYEGGDLYYAGMFLKTILVISLLNEIGLAEDEIIAVFNGNNQYKSDLLFYKNKLKLV